MILKLKLREDVNSEYEKSYSSIDRETFDKIITLDSTARGNQLGSFASNLLLRCYLAGNTSFLDRADEIPAAITKFAGQIRRDPTIDGKYKNPRYFQTVEDFLDFVADPTKEVEGGQQDEVEESKLDSIYRQYYQKDMSREVFDAIIQLDPDTDENGIGELAKLLFIPTYKKLNDVDKDNMLQDKIELRNYAKSYYKHKNNFPSQYQRPDGFHDLDEFKAVCSGGASQESDLITYLKSLGTRIWNDCGYIGSTWEHDMFQPKTRRAAAYIAGADNSIRMPGGHIRRGPGIGESGSRGYQRNIYGCWCTTQGSFWDDYRGRDGSGLYYDFMAKGSALWENQRKANYQIAVQRDGKLVSAADGEEDFSNANKMLPRLISEDPEVLTLCKKVPTHIGLMPEVKIYDDIKSLKDQPFIYKNENSLDELKSKFAGENYKLVVQAIEELEIEDGVTSIPVAQFEGWTSLRKIKFSDSVTKIGIEAFKNCISLTLVELPKNLEYIGGQAFAECIALRGTIKLPKTLKFIGRNAFYKTEVRAFSIPSNTPDGQIIIPVEDWDLYAKKAKVIKSNESLDEDFEVLDENLPWDLAQAYRTAYRSPVPDSRVNYSHPTNDNRRFANFDYKNSEYREITVGEAKSLLRSDRANAKYLRMISNGKLIQFENNRPGEVHPVFGGYVTLTLPDGRRKEARVCTMNQVLDSVDKIYWTDEEDHVLSQEVKDARATKAQETETGLYGSTRLKNVDTGAHHKSDNPAGIYIAEPDIKVDLGDLKDSDILSALRDYTQSYQRKSVLKSKLRKLQAAYTNILKHKDSYEEEEFNEVFGTLVNKLNEVKQEFDEVISKYQKSREMFDKAFDETFIKEYEENHEKLKELAAEVAAKDAELTQLINQLRDLRQKNITDTDEYKQIMKIASVYEASIQKLNLRANGLDNDIQTTEREIERLQQQIELYQKQKDIVSHHIEERQAELDQVKAGCESDLENLSSKLSGELDEAENKINTIKRWFNEHPEAGKQFSMSNPPKEMSPEVRAKLSTGDSDSETTKDENAICLDKFGVSLEKLREIFHWNMTSGHSTDPRGYIRAYDPFRYAADELHIPTHSVSLRMTYAYCFEHANNSAMSSEEFNQEYIDNWFKEIVAYYRRTHPEQELSTRDSSE